MQRRMPNYHQLTIRELMAIALFSAISIVGLSNGGVIASMVITAAIVGMTAFAIVAFVGREQLRSYAIEP
jgi:hypothetical protein